MTVTLDDLLHVANILVVPAFGYIVILERRITRMQTQIEILIDQLKERAHP